MKADTKGYAKGLAFITGTFAVLCIWLLKQYSIQALWKMMLGMRPLWILAAMGLMVVYWVFESLGLHLAVSRFVPTQNPGDTFCATMIGQFFNCITPFSSGGQPMQAWYLVKKGVSLSFASCSLLIKFIVYQFVLTIYSALTLLLCFKSFAGRISSIGWLIFVGFGVNLLVITGLLCLGFLRRPTERFCTEVCPCSKR